MKVWVDILTPKQIQVACQLLPRLREHHEVLPTSRAYSEVQALAERKKLELTYVGEHGGSSLKDKLVASVKRSQLLLDIVENFKPDLLLHFASPDAARLAYQLGMKQICQTDSPNAEAVLRLTIPLATKFLCPWIIPKKYFTRFGINKFNISRYVGLDPAIWLKHTKFNPSKNDIPLITFRLDETNAAYHDRTDRGMHLLHDIITRFWNTYRILVLPRYEEQRQGLAQYAGKITVAPEGFDSVKILEETDIFIGSGGTMNAEASLLGIPNAEYFTWNSPINTYLIKNSLTEYIANSSDLCSYIYNTMNDGKEEKQQLQHRARTILSQMEDPAELIIQTVNKLLVH